MSDCRKCAEFSWCLENEDCGLFKQKPQTNADRIRSMTDEELAEYLIVDIECGVARRVGWPISNEEINHVLQGTLNWLKQEVKE